MVSILIPAYNESERIGATIKALRAMALPEDTELIVIDDGSEDDTAKVAEAAGADTVLRRANGGKGAALAAGALLAGGDILLLLDADLGATASEAARLLAPILSGDADMTVATFPLRPGRGGGVGLVVRLARWGIQRLTGFSPAAPISGQRALRRAVLETTGGFAQGWTVEIALTVRALWAGYRVKEVATNMDHRVTGRTLSAVLHRAMQFKATLFILILLWWQRRKQGQLAAGANPGNG